MMSQQQYDERPYKYSGYGQYKSPSPLSNNYNQFSYRTTSEPISTFAVRDQTRYPAKSYSRDNWSTEYTAPVHYQNDYYKPDQYSAQQKEAFSSLPPIRSTPLPPADTSVKEKYIDSLEKIVVLKEKLSVTDAFLSEERMNVTRLNHEIENLKQTVTFYKSFLSELVDIDFLSAVIGSEKAQSLQKSDLETVRMKTIQLIEDPASMKGFKASLLNVVDSIIESSKPSPTTKNKRAKSTSDSRRRRETSDSDPEVYVAPKAMPWTDLVHKHYPSVNRFPSEMTVFVRNYLERENLNDVRLQSKLPYSARFPHAIPLTHEQDFLHQFTSNFYEYFGLENPKTKPITKKTSLKRKELVSGSNLHKVNRNSVVSKSSVYSEDSLVPWFSIVEEKYGPSIELFDRDGKELQPIKSYAKQFLLENIKDFGYSLRKCLITFPDTKRQYYGIPVELREQFEEAIVQGFDEYLGEIIQGAVGSRRVETSEENSKEPSNEPSQEISFVNVDESFVVDEQVHIENDPLSPLEFAETLKE